MMGLSAALLICAVLFAVVLLAASGFSRIALHMIRPIKGFHISEVRPGFRSVI